MIILSSPPPRARRRWIFIATGIVSAFGAALIGAVGISEFWDAWGESDWAGMLTVAFQFLFCAVGMAAAGYQLVEQIASGDPVQRLIATQETLAFKTRAKPAEFLKRVDCVALVREGRGIAMADGTTYMLHAYGAQQADVDAFIDALYESWWPGLTRTEVRDYLQGLPSPRPKLLLILLGALPVPVFLVVVLSASIRLWLLLGLCLVFLLLSGVFAAALMRLLTRTSGEASYPLFDEEFTAPAVADWEEQVPINCGKDLLWCASLWMLNEPTWCGFVRSVMGVNWCLICLCPLHQVLEGLGAQASRLLIGIATPNNPSAISNKCDAVSRLRREAGGTPALPALRDNFDGATCWG